MALNEYTEKINLLKKRVNNYSTENKMDDKIDEQITGIKNENKLINKVINKIYYVIPPIFILLLLFIFKPNFILKNKTYHSNGQKPNKHIVFRKIIFCSLFIGIIIDFGIWYFLNKQV